MNIIGKKMLQAEERARAKGRGSEPGQAFVRTWAFTLRKKVGALQGFS